MSYELHLHNLSRLHDEYETALQQRNAEGKKLGDVVLFDGKTASCGCARPQFRARFGFGLI
jgi:hypothetical protein